MRLIVPASRFRLQQGNEFDDRNWEQSAASLAHLPRDETT